MNIRSTLLVAFSFTLNLVCYGNRNCLPVIEEDKIWVYRSGWFTTEQDETSEYSYYNPEIPLLHYMKFDGKCDIGGKEYHAFKVIRREYYNKHEEKFDDSFTFPEEVCFEPIYYLREENGKLFLLCVDNVPYGHERSQVYELVGESELEERISETCVYNMSLESGQSFDFPTNIGFGDINTTKWTVKNEWITSECGIPRKEIQIQEEYGIGEMRVVEGISILNNGHLGLPNNNAVSCIYCPREWFHWREPWWKSTLHCVYTEGGDILYKAPDYESWAVTHALSNSNEIKCRYENGHLYVDAFDAEIKEINVFGILGISLKAEIKGKSANFPLPSSINGSTIVEVKTENDARIFKLMI